MASVDHPPLILVSHLPSAASFYSALTQPLGLQFLSATSTIPACLHFGYLLSTSSGPRKITVFTVSQSAHPRLSHITLSAPTPKAVFDFHGRSQLYRGATRGNSTFEQNGIEERALTRDFDGNVIEAVYGSSALVRSAGMAPGLNKECKRVLEWQQDVARSISGSEVGGGGVAARAGAPVFRRAETCPTGFGCEHPTRIVVRETVTEHFANAGGPEVPAPPEPKSGGISSKTVLGTLLGAAAGAAFAYAMTRSESPPKPTGRRASEPQYTHEPIVMEDRECVVEAGTIPARSHISERDKETDIRPRYVQYAIAAPPGSPALSRVQELGKIEEGSCVSTSSHRSSRSKKDRETTYERPLAILPAPSRDRSPAADVDPDADADVDTKSHASRREKSPDADTKSHVSHRSHRSHRSRRSESGTGSERGRRREEREAEKEKEKDKDKDSEYISARSHHTASTIKPFKASSNANTLPAAPQPPPATSASRVSTSSRSSKHHHHNNSHKDGSRVSASGRRSSVSTARPAPLPRSMVSGLGRDAFGDSNSNSDDDGPFGKGSRYAASVAPSDSVSSVGTKRERERLAERMVFRERAKGVLWGHS
ncbi:hypothetical protein LZ554_006452 [Drepanopeziza brunnea f. sp. 'monogermtubi']|nr:hypothetical protein LZ554_006452 [Drepanopeziza brunnea f. sp. 'monogermtubi']